MIRLVQRRLIVPRGDTGTFSIPILAGKDSGDAAIFTVFDPLMHRKIFEKEMSLSDGALGVDFTHNDTVNLPVGQYVWDIKFYTDPLIVDGKLIGGTEVDSYYSAFTLPICEIRETGDNLLMSDDAPTGALRPGQVDIITASIREITSLKESAAESAANADTSATNAESSASAAATSAQDALDSKVAALAAQQTASAASENATSAAANAQASATLAAQRADQVMVELGTKANIEDLAAVAFSGLYSDLSGVPTRVSQFINDAGYLTQHQDISGKANLADLATVAISGSYNDLEDKPTIPDVQINGNSIVDNGIANIPMAVNGISGVVKVDPTGNSGISTSAIIGTSYGKLTITSALNSEVKDGSSRYKPIVPRNQHQSVFYGLAKAAGDTTQSVSTNAVGTYTAAAKEAIQQMLDVPSKSEVQNLISISTSAPQGDDAKIWIDTDDSTTVQVPTVAEMNLALAGKADIEDIPEVPVQDIQVNGSSILNNGTANIPIATSEYFGVVRVGSGLGMSSAGGIRTQQATSPNIKNGTENYQVIVPAKQHESVFYGLATAAGDTTQKVSTNAVGTYTTEAKTAIRTMLDVPSTSDIPSVPVQDVQVNGASILDAQGIANIPYANDSVPGVVKVSSTYGIKMVASGTMLGIDGASATNIKAGETSVKPITPYHQHESTFYGLATAAGDSTQKISTNTVGTYTNEAKEAIQTMLGVTDALASKLDAAEAGLKVVRLI